MEINNEKSDKSKAYAAYKLIKLRKNKNGDSLCCQEWLASFSKFNEWYTNRLKVQDGGCEYCHLPGNTMKHYGKNFRKGRRGINFEVDRIEPKGLYSSDNCVLACYPCNNAKSDVFSYDEFKEIGKTIGFIKMSG